MRKDVVLFDINNINDTKLKMDNNYNEIISSITKYKEMIEDTVNIYDTESGALYRKVAIAYANIVLRYLNNELKPHIDKLDEIKRIYLEEINAVSDSVGGNS